MMDGDQPASIKEAICNFLLDYRVTPSPTYSATPAALFVGRELQHPFTLLKRVTNPIAKARSRQKRNADRSVRKLMEFDAGDPVWYQDPSLRRKKKWRKARIIQTLGQVLVEIELEEGARIRVHQDFLRPRESS